MAKGRVQVRRIYEDEKPDDGRRVLVGNAALLARFGLADGAATDAAEAAPLPDPATFDRHVYSE